MELEEEKKTIEYLKELLSLRISKTGEIKHDTCIIGTNALKVILNLIEKLKKENEELKNKVIKRDNDIIYLEETAEKEFLTKIEVKANYIPKDKIRAKLEGLKLIDEYEAPNGWESERMYSEEILEELLKEE